VSDKSAAPVSVATFPVTTIPGTTIPGTTIPGTTVSGHGPDAPPAAGDAAAAAPHVDASLDRLRVNIAKVIQRYFQPLFVITLLAVGFLFVIIVVGMYRGTTIATMALAASVQVAFGMIIGYVCVYIGLMMTWFGIDASYSFKGSLDVGGAKSEGALKSASPGLLFALGGMVLIAVSLYKPIVYQENNIVPIGVQATSKLGGETSVNAPLTPAPAPPLPTTRAATSDSP
jgi:hypothetical protein